MHSGNALFQSTDQWNLAAVEKEAMTAVRPRALETSDGDVKWWTQGDDADAQKAALSRWVFALQPATQSHLHHWINSTGPLLAYYKENVLSYAGYLKSKWRNDLPQS